MFSSGADRANAWVTLWVALVVFMVCFTACQVRQCAMSALEQEQLIRYGEVPRGR